MKKFRGRYIAICLAAACAIVLTIVQVRKGRLDRKLMQVLRIEDSPEWSRIERICRDRQDGIDVETYRFYAAADSTTAYLLLSNPSAQKSPAILVMHGHLSSAKDMVWGSGHPWVWPVARNLAEHGFVVLVPEIRFETRDFHEETRQAFQLLLSGHTLMGERVLDAIRSIGFLSGHPAVDPNRIGCLGWSMGGSIALYAAAIDPRIRAIYVSGAASALRAHLLPDAPLQSPDNYVPFLLSDFGDKDVLIRMIHPRPIFIEHGETDPIETPAGVRETLLGVKALYESPASRDLLKIHIHRREHALDGSQARAWFHQWIKE